MNENWQQVKEIFTKALGERIEHRSFFISQQCSGNKNLENEVKSLLDAYISAETFMETPAVANVADTFLPKVKELQEGEFLSHYRIIRKIGKGGMGEVYLAQDTRLGRKVAIKILGDYIGNNQTNLKRFIIEAQTASSLNHPNIVIIHEIDEKDDFNFIVSEFIEGLTISEILKQKKLSLTQICDISIQVAKALAAAHEVGIIHRDIKPDNVMMRADGIVKVLDFGLAKLVAEESETNLIFDENSFEKMDTRAGMILGTIAYMSPEQTRGKTVDTRTDVWSFGVLLYQLLSRKLPFHGDTTTDLMVSILTAEPAPLTENAPHVPKTFQEIIRRTLMKNPDARFQTITEILDELKNFRRELDYEGKTEPFDIRVSGQNVKEKKTDPNLTKFTLNESNTETDSDQKRSFIGASAVRFQSASPIPLLALLLCGIILTLGYFGWSKFNSPQTQISSFQKMRFAKLTYEGQASSLVTVSPDGKNIAYVLKNEGKQSLIVRQVTTAGKSEIIPADDVSYLSLAFSPDGNSIYYSTSKSGSPSELNEIPFLGGTPRKIMNFAGDQIAFSPDGQLMAFVELHKSIMITDIKGGQPRLLAKANDGENLGYLTWKPDGKSVFATVYGSDDKFYVTEFSSVDGTEKRLPTPPWIRLNGLKFLPDGSGLLIAGRDAETQFSQIWFAAYPSGETQRITNDLNDYIDLSLTADGRSLVTVKNERLFNVWKVPNGKTENAKKITSEEGRDEGIGGLAQTPDGKIIYTVRKAGLFDLWIVNNDGSENHQLTFDQGSNLLPSISPDGKSVVFISDRAGNNNIWRMNTDGTNQQVFKDTPTIKESYPNFTPDGKWLIHQETNPQNQTNIWKMNVETGESVQLTNVESIRPVVSPDGKFVACQLEGSKNEKPNIFIVSVDGKIPVKILDAPLMIKSGIYRWSLDSKSLIYVDRKGQTHNLWSQPIDNSPPKQLTFFESGQIQKFEITDNGQGFILSRGNESSDVLMITDFR